jgi:hypothetical protein
MWKAAPCQIIRLKGSVKLSVLSQCNCKLNPFTISPALADRVSFACAAKRWSIRSWRVCPSHREDTQGQFALSTQSPDKAMFRPRTFIIGKRKPSICWKARSPFRWAVARSRNNGLLRRRALFTIESEQLRMLILLTPAGMEGWFREFSVPASAMTLPPPAETPYRRYKECLRLARDMVSNLSYQRLNTGFHEYPNMSVPALAGPFRAIRN